MQPSPGLHVHGAVLAVVFDMADGRRRPRGGVAGVELGAVAAGAAALAGRHPRWWVGVKATPRPQPHQDRGGHIGQPQRQAGGIVAGVEHKQRHLPAGGQAPQQRADLGGGGLVVVVAWCRRRASTGAVQLSRVKLSWAIHWNDQPATIGWPAEWREGW
jgi:hypothetical protein